MVTGGDLRDKVSYFPSLREFPLHIGGPMSYQLSRNFLRIFQSCLVAEKYVFPSLQGMYSPSKVNGKDRRLIVCDNYGVLEIVINVL